MNTRDHADFKIGNSVGTYKESVTISTGQVGMTEAMLKGKTVVSVRPDRKGLLIELSDGTSVAIKGHTQKTIELSYLENQSAQPRRYVVNTG